MEISHTMDSIIIVLFVRLAMLVPRWGSLIRLSHVQQGTGVVLVPHLQLLCALIVIAVVCMEFVMLDIFVHKAHRHNYYVQMVPSVILQELNTVPHVLEVITVTHPLVLIPTKIAHVDTIVQHRQVLLFLHAPLALTERRLI